MNLPGRLTGGIGNLVRDNPLPAGSTVVIQAPPSPFGGISEQRVMRPTIVTENTDMTLPFGPGAGRIDMRPPIFGGYQGLQG